MRKAEFVKEIAATTGCTHAQVDSVLTAFWNLVEKMLRDDPDARVSFAGIGTFKTKDVPAREGTNYLPNKEGKKWFKPAHREVVFIPSREFKMLDAKTVD